MSYYEDVYLRRINRYGTDYKSRLQGQREKVFEDLLLKSIYRVDFNYNNILEPGLLERYRQDDTKTIQYLLTRVDLNIPNGTILEIEDKDLVKHKWMILYLEYIEASGYNRYFVIEMSGDIKWTHTNNYVSPEYSSPVYLYGPHNAAIRDILKQQQAIYTENSANYYIIMPLNQNLVKGDYFKANVIANNQTVAQQYQVIGFDIQSNPGVAFVTIDPVYKFDESAVPVKPQGSTDPGYDWFNGDFGGNN